MDCVDCHNRPTHAFELPQRGLDREITAGSISRDLPFVKKKALELLKAKYTSQDEATKAIADGLTAYYAATYPDLASSKKAEIEAAVKAVQAVYLQERLPEHEARLGLPPEQHRPRGLPGLLPLPRREPRVQGREGRSRPTARPATRCSRWKRRTRRS